MIELNTVFLADFRPSTCTSKRVCWQNIYPIYKAGVEIVVVRGLNEDEDSSTLMDYQKIGNIFEILCLSRYFA